MQCEYCEKEIEEIEENHARTKSGHYFCSYTCFEDYFGGDINAEDDFTCVPD